MIGDNVSYVESNGEVVFYNKICKGKGKTYYNWLEDKNSYGDNLNGY